MREVSSRVFQIFFKPLAARGIPLDTMVKGTRVSLATLRDKTERIDWADHNAIMANLRPHFTDEDLREIGRSYFRDPALRFMGVIARLRFTPMAFYHWVNKPREASAQMFTCVVPTMRELSDHELEVDLVLADGYELCWEFYVIASANFEEMSRLLGLPPAKVRLTRLPRGGRFHITLPRKVSVVRRAGRALARPFALRDAATELEEAHASLRQRYDQLQDAKAEIDAQRALLDTAYQIGQRVWSMRELQTICDTVAHSLVELDAIDGARLAVADAAGLSLGAAGAQGADDQAIVVALPGAPSRGDLAVWTRDPAMRSLLDLLAPTLALAIDNAFAYRALADYQKGLERKVEERTAELRTARDSLAATVTALEEARDARERIFANISHEIRTPLSLVLLAVRDVEARAALDDASRDGMRSIEVSARKLLRLVDELLLLAAGEARSLRLKPEAIDVSAIVSTLATTWRPAAEHTQVTLAADVVPDQIATADPVAVERIVSNLLSNALKYTPRGGSITLGVAPAAPDREQIAISVRDTGVGIDDDLMARLFGRFEQGASPNQVRGGSGIGLSLVKELAIAQGGDVAVARLAPRGTEFRVTLPASATAPVAAGSPTLRPGDFGHAAATIATGDVLAPEDKSTPTILLAEDDPALARSIAQLLADDYTVVVALDGAAALELAVRYQPHLLVTAVEMPKMNGVELTRRFRDLAGNGLAPVVMLSALADIKDRLTGLDAGAVDYVVKPFDPRDLKARVRAQLEMRTLALRVQRAEKLAALGTLSAGLAHELRNPANGIVNAIAPLRELLPAEVTSPASGTGQLLEVLGACAEQISSLSKQLLGFRRGGELDLRDASLGDVVGRALALVAPTVKGIEVRDRVAAGARIKCAMPLLVQVVTNLIENAAHAAGKGGWIELSSHVGGGRVVIEVADSGPGVPHELRERIFEPFFTTKAPGSGTGLGLPVARDIVTRHRGVLEVRERAGRCVFAIDLPDHADREAT